MNNHLGMNGMNVNGMMPGMNGANGGMPMMNHGANGAGGSRTSDQEREDEYGRRLNTYIYEYFIHHEQWDCAEVLLKSGLTVTTKDKASPSRRRDVNGDSSMEMDSKDNLDTKRVMRNLPAPDVPASYNNSPFLFEWFSLFWDMFFAQRKDGKASAQAMQYVQHTQQRMRQDPRFLQNPGMMTAGMAFQHNMVRLPQGGMPMNQNDLRQRAAQQNNIRNVYVQPTPQQISMARNQQMLQQQQAMQRDGSDVDINGQRPRTPSSGDNAPSPSKRPRLDPQFNNGQVMMNGGRPAQGMPGQIIHAANAAQANSLLMQHGIDPTFLSTTQLESFQAQNTQVQKKSIQVYAQNMAAQHQQRMPQAGMPNQGSPMMQPGMDPTMGDLYNGSGRMHNGMPTQNGTSNHALQDYQMQLMLLEQQNKKRLLMARQEQDNMRPEGQPGQNGMFTGMSPQGSRSGPSPNPNDQAKRGTPKMVQPGSPLPDGSMSQARGSPAVMNTFGQIPEMYQQPLKMGEGMVAPMGANGNVVRSGPPFNNAPFNPQMEAMGRAQAAQNGGRVQNAAWPQGQQGQPAMIPQPPQAQTPQTGTPLQRAMPPPSAVPAANTANGRPSSPAQPNPPTPSQQNKANPKTKKDSDKARKKPTKKASVPNATPSSETENQAATPAPSTPVTPAHPPSFKDKNNGNQNQPSNLQSAAAIPPASNPIQPPQPEMNGVGFVMPDMDPSIDMGFSHALDSGDVLDHFDFDSFLQENGEHELQFDGPMSFGNFDGVEASAGDA